MADSFRPLPARPAPVATEGLLPWLRRNLFSNWQSSLVTVLMVAAVIGRPKALTYVALVALFSVVAGLLYGAWVDGVNPGWIAAGLLAFMGVLAAMLSWMLGRRTAPARA